MVFALSSVFKAPQKNTKRNRRTAGHLSQYASTNSVNSSDAEKRRKVRFRSSDTKAVITPPPSLSSASSNTTSSTQETSSSFEPRRSKRISKSSLRRDGDTWIECSVVNVKHNKRRRIKGKKQTNEQHSARSLFYSVETQRGRWDEPPSGASNVVYLGQGGGLEVVRKKRRKS